MTDKIDVSMKSLKPVSKLCILPIIFYFEGCSVCLSNYNKTVQIVSKLPTIIQTVPATADKTCTSPYYEQF